MKRLNLLFLFWFTALIPFSVYANRYDPAAEAMDLIRPGVLESKRQLAVELIIGLGDEGLSHGRKLAASSEPIQRAAGLAVLSANSAAAECYLPFLNDPHYEVRRAALDGIENAPNMIPEAWQAVFARLDDPFWPVRRVALRAVAAHPTSGAAALFFRAIQDPEPAVRRTALQFMVTLTEDLPANVFDRASQSLSTEEHRLFLANSLPLVRSENLDYFQQAADRVQDDASRTLALLACAAVTREVPDDAVDTLIDQAVNRSGSVGDAACTLLSLAGERVAPFVRTRLAADRNATPVSLSALLMVFEGALGPAAVPYLSGWIQDSELPQASRAAGLERLMEIRSDAAASVLIKLFPLLDPALQARVAQMAMFMKDRPGFSRLVPLFKAVIEAGEPDWSRNVFTALCLAPEPPTSLLISIVKAEEDPDLRRAYILNLVHAAREDRREAIARFFLDELAQNSPAAIEAALQLPALITPSLTDEALKRVKALLAEHTSGASREALLFTLVALKDPDSDRLLAEWMEQALESGQESDIEFFVMHLDESKGPYTAALLHRLYEDADDQLRCRILRTLVRRSDPRAAVCMEEVFAFASLGFRRSILADLESAPDLAQRCGSLLQRIIRQERDPDLLAGALSAASLTLLQSEEARLLALADLGAELGMETAEAVYRALARIGTDAGRGYLRARVHSFLDQAKQDAGPALFDGFEAGLAKMAALQLAGVNDDKAPALLADLLFLRTLAFRERQIIEGWGGTESGHGTGKAHTWARSILRGLCMLDPAAAQEAVLKMLDDWAESGDLHQCGDAAFCMVLRELAADPEVGDGFTRLIDRLESLTLACAPIHSPADFRIYTARAARAEAGGDLKEAARAFEAVYKILEFHCPARPVLQQELGDGVDPDPFKGYEPKAYFASKMHLARARVFEQSGRKADAEAERRKARQRSPFLKRAH